MKNYKLAPLAAGMLAALFAVGAQAGEGKDQEHPTAATTTAGDTSATGIDATDTTLTKEEEAARATDNAPTMSEASTHGKSDAHRVQMLASGGLMEVEAGKLAVEKGTSAEVKAYGQKMIDDHTKNNEELKALATAKGLEIPAAPLQEEQAALDRLSKLSGEAFDKAYMADMVDSHAKMERLLTETSTDATDADVREFAKKTLVPVKEHEQHAKQLNDDKDSDAVAKEADGDFESD